MKIPCGSPRKLTDRQIIRVLEWHREVIEFRRAHGTTCDLAHVLGVSFHVVRACFEMRVPLNRPRIPISHSAGRAGRPRHLSPAQIAFAVAWRNVGRQFRARHGTVASLACTLGVGASTIHDCIRRKGWYTQSNSVTACRASLHRSDDAIRAALLRRWPRPRSQL